MPSANTASLSDAAFAAACIASGKAANLRTTSMLKGSNARKVAEVYHVPCAWEVVSPEEEHAIMARAEATRIRVARLFKTVH